MVVNAFFNEGLYPGAVKVLWLELGDQHPQASGDVTEDDEHEHKEEEPLKTQTNFKELIDVFEELTFLLHDLENPEQPRKLDKLVKAPNFGQPRHTVGPRVLSLLENKIKRSYCKDINDKPPLAVIFSDGHPFIYQIHLFIVVLRVEYYHDIDTKEEVGDLIQNFLSVWALTFKRYLVGGQKASHQEHNSHERIPGLFSFRVMVDQEGLRAIFLFASFGFPHDLGELWDLVDVDVIHWERVFLDLPYFCFLNDTNTTWLRFAKLCIGACFIGFSFTLDFEGIVWVIQFKLELVHNSLLLSQNVYFLAFLPLLLLFHCNLWHYFIYSSVSYWSPDPIFKILFPHTDVVLFRISADAFDLLLDFLGSSLLSYIEFGKLLFDGFVSIPLLNFDGSWGPILMFPWLRKLWKSLQTLFLIAIWRL